MSVVEAFAAQDKQPRGTHIRNANRASKNFRSVDGQSYTIVASHPLVWATDGKSVRVFEPYESALLMTFPPQWDWKADTKVKSLLGIGNAVPPSLAEAVVRAVLCAPSSPASLTYRPVEMDHQVRNIPEEIMAEVRSMKRKLAEVVDRLDKMEK